MVALVSLVALVAEHEAALVAARAAEAAVEVPAAAAALAHGAGVHPVPAALPAHRRHHLGVLGRKTYMMFKIF